MDDFLWLKHYDVDIPRHIDYPKIPAHRFLDEAAELFPNRPAIIYKETSLTFKELNKLVNQLSAALFALGLRKGERVAILLPNIPQFVESYFAILRIGGVVVAINPILSGREIQYYLKNSGAKTAIVLDKIFPTIKEIQANTNLEKIIVVNAENTALDDDSPTNGLKENDIPFSRFLHTFSNQDPPSIPIFPDDIALFQYTGGTTGIPKAAVALHRNIVANAMQFHAWTKIGKDENDRILISIPMSHVYGMVCGMLLAIRSGSSMVLIDTPRDIGVILEAIQKHRATFFLGVPTLYNAINNFQDLQAGKYDLSSLKVCISGSAKLLHETWSKFVKMTKCALVEGFGLSEAPTCTHCNPLQANQTAGGSFGLPLPDTEARIISMEDGKTILPPGEIGELIVRGPQLSPGYFDMPDETAGAFHDGWLHTGDIVKMDENGYFYFIDRKKDMIKPGGYQVWPNEVEEILKENPKILEVAVGGIPDEYRGEIVKAWVVLQKGVNADANEIREWCRGRIALFKIPSQIEFRIELPKTPVGKILRRELIRQSIDKN
jgi:long-chain acyl-CoA synthetase